MSDSPKPPPERITMSLPVVNAAKDVVFVALGEGKAEIVQRVLEVRCISIRMTSLRDFYLDLGGSMMTYARSFVRSFICKQSVT